MAVKDHVHPSKIDFWMGAIVAGSIIASVIAMLMASESSRELFISVACAVIAAWTAIAAVSWPIAYEIGEEMLTVRSGLIKWKIPLHSIQQVLPTANPISSPAWSLDRLQIRYLKDKSEEYICISPRDKLNFYEDLAIADPNLQIDGDRITRRGFEDL